MSPIEDPIQFRWRLAETIAWCTSRASLADPQHSLRTPALQPAATYSRNSINQEIVDYQWEDTTEQPSIVSTLMAERATLLRAAHQYPTAPAPTLVGGRLLIYWPYENAFDGAAKGESRGLFDVDNIPPWDTWVCYVAGKISWELISWVPPQLISLADKGIRVNPEQCIQWADLDDGEVALQLREARLLI